MEENNYPIKFVCKHNCEECLLDEWALASNLNRTRSVRSCKYIMHTWFEGEVITQEEYDEILAMKENAKNLIDDYSKFRCPSTKAECMCSYCEVCSFITDLGYIPATLTAQYYRNFRLPNAGKKYKNCKELMKSLCGTEIYRKTPYKIPEIDTATILGFEDTLRNIIQHLYDVEDGYCAPGEILPKDAIIPFRKTYAHKVSMEHSDDKECEVDTTERLYDKYQHLYNWNPPFKYTGDAQDLCKYAQDFNELRDDIFFVFGKENGTKFIQENKLRSLPIPVAIKLFKEKIIVEQKLDYSEALHKPYLMSINQMQAIYNKYCSYLYDFKNDQLYTDILDAPVCCGNCDKCIINNKVYKMHTIVSVSSSNIMNRCHVYAPNFSDEIAKLFGYEKLSDYINSDNAYRLMIVPNKSIKRKVRQIIAEKILEERNKNE